MGFGFRVPSSGLRDLRLERLELETRTPEPGT